MDSPMIYLVPASLFAVFAWWFSTGAILYLDRLPRQTFNWTLLSATVLLTLAIHGLVETAEDPSPVGAYLAFLSALTIWGWHELTFLMGWVTGPRRIACPPGTTGWQRFRYATAVVIHHEMALAATLVAIVLLSWGEPNQVATWTFLVLWAMRISAKLNLFLGVRNLTEEFIPEHLEYMKSYFRKKKYNPLMPISLTASIGTVYLLVRGGLGEGSTPHDATGYALVGTLLALAALEHLFLMMPIPDAVLWRWALRASEGRCAPERP